MADLDLFLDRSMVKESAPISQLRACGERHGHRRYSAQAESNIVVQPPATTWLWSVPMLKSRILSFHWEEADGCRIVEVSCFM